MKVACATAVLSESFRQYFPDMTIIGTPDKVPDDLDLLILTGGNDINPNRYKSLPNGAFGWSDVRDDNEFSILTEALYRNRGTKVLGVCRGLQLINIFCGGNLLQDINSAGKPHRGVHDIMYSVEDHPLSWLKVVNSLHHQAVRKLGGKFFPYILAYEPKTQIPEIVTWENTLLGVQFHPEMFSAISGDKFFSIIKSWVNGELSLGYDGERDYNGSDSDSEEDGGEDVFDNDTTDENINPHEEDTLASDLRRSTLVYTTSIPEGFSTIGAGTYGNGEISFSTMDLFPPTTTQNDLQSAVEDTDV